MHCSDLVLPVTARGAFLVVLASTMNLFFLMDKITAEQF
jgi:hypothetical protein